MSGERPILRRIDQLLRMLAADTHGERLLDQLRSGTVQKGKNIPGAMPRGQDQRIGRQELLPIPLCDRYTRELSVFYAQIRELRAEAHLAAVLQNHSPQAPDRLRQAVRSDMWFGLPQDLMRRARRGKIHKHTHSAAVVGAGGQLSVGKRAGPALTELHVGFRVQHPCAQETLYILPTFVHAAPSFDEKRLGSRTGKRKRREQSRRSRSADDRTIFRLSLQSVRKRVRARNISRKTLFPMPKGYGRRDKKVHVRLSSRVYAPPQQHGFLHFGQLDTKLFRTGGFQISVQRKAYIPHLDHIAELLPAARPEANAQ